MVTEMQTKTNRGREGILACVYVRFFFIYSYSPDFPIDRNEDCFFSTLFLSITFLFSALSIIFFAHFRQKCLLIHWL